MLPVVYRRQLNVPSFEACICFHEQLPSWFKSLLNHNGLLSLGSARQKVDKKKSSQSKASVESFKEKAMATLPLWKKNLDENGDGEVSSFSPWKNSLNLKVYDLLQSITVFFAKLSTRIHFQSSCPVVGPTARVKVLCPFTYDPWNL